MIYAILLVPFAAAGIAYALRSLRFAAATFSAAAAAALAVLLVLGAGAPQESLFGRSLILYSPVRAQLAFGLVLLAIAFVSTWHLPENNLTWMLAFLAAGFMLWAVAVQIMSLSVLFLMASVIVMVMAAPMEPGRPSLWSIRTLVLIVAAGLLMVAAAWIIDNRPGVTGSAPGQLGPILLFLGYWVLIAAFPFSVWQLPALRADASVPRVLFGIVLPQTLLVQIMLHQQTVLSPINALVPVLLFYAGLATFILGGIGVAAQKTMNGMLAYLALGEMGSALMALGSGANFGEALGVTLLFYRGIAIVAMSIGIRILSKSLGDDELETMRGAFRRAPLAVIGTLLAGLSLAGFPPMAGFAARFSLYRMVALQRMPWAVLMIAAGSPAVLALTRFAVRSFQIVPVPGSRREQLWPAALVLGLSGLLLLLGFLPQATVYLSEQWADLFTGLAIPLP
ncbi:MAG: proton-conducting transporter transmembrane domain-containing protein [Anaerolineae bacterium]